MRRLETPVSQDSQSKFRQRLPHAQLVDRCEFLVQKSAGKRVIHLGFANVGLRERRWGEGTWLHERFSESARELVGVDIDELEVEVARQRGFEAYCADCSSKASLEALGLEPAEIVIAGEVIEHVNNAGQLLEALHVLTATDGVLIVTTPNAYGWLNPAAAILGYEFVNPDHLAIYSCYTLTKVLERNGWSVDEILTYALPGVLKRPRRRITERLQATAAQGLLLGSRLIARRSPFVADGLIAVCTPS